MFISYIFTISLVTNMFCSAESAYSIKPVTGPIGIVLETPNWSELEQALYFVDIIGQTLYRYDGVTGKVTTKKTMCGLTGLIIPLANAPPGYVLVGVSARLNVVDFNAPGTNLDVAQAFRPLTYVDAGKPDNIIHDAKVDPKGRLWFGTFGKIVGDIITPDQGSLYMITNTTYTCPKVVIRPVTQSDGLTWSLDHKKFYYNDQPTRKVAVYDYNLNTGEIGNKTIFFDFCKKRVSGTPNGMTIDSKGNIWLATFEGKKVLKIDPVTAKILLEIELPEVDQVTSVIFGGKNYTTLFVTTGKVNKQYPKPMSGSLYAITNLFETRGLPPNYMEISNVENY